MTTSHDDVILLLSRGLDGDLSGDEAALMYAHVARCDACRLAMGEFAALTHALEAFNRHIDTVSLTSTDPAAASCVSVPKQTEGGLDQLRRFTRHVARNDNLRKSLSAAQDSDNFARLCVQLGQQHGYAFDTGQVTSWLTKDAANDGELDDAQLDRVAAGTGFDNRVTVDFFENLLRTIADKHNDQ